MSRKKAPASPLLWAEEPAPLAAAHDRFLDAQRPPALAPAEPDPATGPEPKPAAIVAEAIARALRHRLPWLSPLVTHAQLTMMVRHCLVYVTRQWMKECTVTLEDLCDCPHTPPGVAEVLREKMPPGWQLWTDFCSCLVKNGDSITARIPLE